MWIKTGVYHVAFSLVEGRHRNSNLILSFMGSLELHLASNLFLLLFFSFFSYATGFQFHLYNIFLVSEAYQISQSQT